MDARNFKMAAEKASFSKKVVIIEEDIPGAKLPRENVEECTVPQLRRWLLCRGAKTSGKKADLVKRFAQTMFLLLIICQGLFLTVQLKFIVRHRLLYGLFKIGCKTGGQSNIFDNNFHSSCFSLHLSPYQSKALVFYDWEIQCKKQCPSPYL